MRPQLNRTAAWMPLSAVILCAFCLVFLGLGSPAHAASTNNPCSLLTVAEVETVLGTLLVGPPFRASNGEPSTTGDTCRYEAASFHAIEVQVDWADGGMMFGMVAGTAGLADAAGLKGIYMLADGTELKGAWDQAAMFMCCQFNALHGDQRVMIDISATKLTAKDAGALADKAVQRLDQPLDVADDLGVAEAEARDATRPVIASACTLVTRAEAETLIGAPLTAEPDGSESGCTYVWTPAGAEYQEQIKLMVTWRGGFAEMRATQSAIGMGLDMLADQGLDLKQDPTAPDLLFDAYSTSIIGVMGVRKDVLLSIESGPMSDTAAQFLALAAAKL
ncbi:MAG: hypothetical protein ABI832_13495 [bacterium]